MINPSDLPPLILPGEYTSLRFDPFGEGPVERLALEDIYKNQFLEENPNYSGKHAVISVLSKSTTDGSNTIHQCLTTSAKGYNEFKLVVRPGSETLVNRILQALKEQEKTDQINYIVRALDFAQELATVEQRHPQKRSVMKIGVLYVAKGEVKPKHWFLNGTPKGAPCEKRFWELMDCFGQKTDLGNYTGYLGDMGQKGLSYVDTWQNVEVMYHVSPMLTSEEHRRLVGNDIALLFFIEPDSQFDLSGLSGLGTVGQVYAAVQPVSEYLWRMAFFCNTAIKEHAPLPSPHLVTLGVLKDIVLTRLFNGLCMTIYSGSVSRLWYIPRSEFLENIITQYPILNPKEIKAVEKQRREETSNIFAIKGRKLVGPKQPTVAEIHVVVNLKDGITKEDEKKRNKHKTRPVASVAPVWNHDFTFPVSSFDTVFTDLELTVFRNGVELLGVVLLSCREIHENGKNGRKLAWYQLQQTPEDICPGELFLFLDIQPTS